MQRPSRGYEQRPKLIFLLISRGHKCWESFEGRYCSWTLENNCSKWYWQVLLADPAIRGEQSGNSPSKFSKTCSVEYVRWVLPCLLSKLKSLFVVSLKTMTIPCFFFYKSWQWLLEKKCPALKIYRSRTVQIVVILIYLTTAANETFFVFVTVYGAFPL